MRIDNIVIFPVYRFDRLEGFLLVTVSRPEKRGNLLKSPLVDAILAVLCQCGHPIGHGSGIMSRNLIQEPFEIARNKDIHCGRHGLVKIPLPVVCPRVDEFGQYIVHIGSANQPVDRQAHPAGIKRGEDVSEISCGHGYVYFRTGFDFFMRNKRSIRRKIIYYLRRQPAPIDRICRRQPKAGPPQHIIICGIRKYLFYALLRIVEIAVHSNHMDIGAFLGYHLEFLYPAHSALRVEYDYLCPPDIFESFEGRLSGISRSGDQYHYLIFFTCLMYRFDEKMRHQLERHVFKSACGAMPKLKHEYMIVQLAQRSDIRMVKS